MTDQIILTTDGKKKMEEELAELINVRRPAIIEKIEQAKEMGDLSENAEYHDAKDQQGLMEARIQEIQEILKKAIVREQSETTDRIEIGTTFVVKDDAGKEKELTIVGFNEADPAAGRISNESPMGKAFLRRKVGEKIEVDAPKGVVVYKISKIK